MRRGKSRKKYLGENSKQNKVKGQAQLKEICIREKLKTNLGI